MNARRVVLTLIVLTLLGGLLTAIYRLAGGLQPVQGGAGTAADMLSMLATAGLQLL